MRLEAKQKYPTPSGRSLSCFISLVLPTTADATPRNADAAQLGLHRMNHRVQYSNPFGDTHTARITGADGTLIRHFLVGLASTMSPLPVRMISSSVEASLMLTVVFATLP